MCVCVSLALGVHCPGQLCSIAPDCIELVAGSCICQNGISHLISTRLATLNYNRFLGCRIKTVTNFEIFFSREKVICMVSPSACCPCSCRAVRGLSSCVTQGKSPECTSGATILQKGRMELRVVSVTTFILLIKIYFLAGRW